MSKKKILFMIHTLQVGGAERVLVDLVNNMNKNKYDITVMTVVDAGALKNKLDKNIKYSSILKNPLARHRTQSKTTKKSGNLLDKAGIVKKIAANVYQLIWRYADCEKIYRRKIKDDYDVEIAFLEGVSTKIIANSNNKNSKKIAWVHIDLLKEKKSENFYKNNKEEKQTYEKYDKIVCVSNDVAKSVKEKFSIDDRKIIVKYNPIDGEKIIEKSKERPLKYKKDKFTICAIGRLSPQKAFDRLINCMDKLTTEKIEADLWIIGVGQDEKKLKKLIERKKLKNVKLLGYQENPYKYIRAVDIIVCSSITEGFSTVISEAVVLKKPIVATDCSGMTEILGENSEYGLVCKNDEESLYESIKEMATNQKMRRRYSEATDKRAQMFDLRTAIKNIELLLDGQLVQETGIFK